MTQNTTKKYGSDIIVDVLKQHNIGYVAFNPGSSIKGIQDSIVNYATNINLILCCHEEIAVAIAHGYAKASNKYMCVMVHANVGLMHASMAIFNAWCDRVPMLIIGGTGPLDSEKRRPWIDWIHSSNIQANLVSDFVKWHDQPTSIQGALASVYRACKITNTHPTAPVYISMDPIIQEQQIENNISLYDLNKYTPTNPPPVNEVDLQKITDLLLKAKFPIIVADYLGRNKEALEKLIALAELLGIAVIDCGGRYNFPNNHPLSLTGANTDVIAEADLIVAFDVQDLSNFSINNNKIVHISLNNNLISKWAADYQKLIPLELDITADSNIVLSQIYNSCNKLITQEVQGNIKLRTEYIKEKHTTCKLKWQKIALDYTDNSKMNTASVVQTIWKVVKKEDFILTYSGGLAIRDWVKKLWEFNSKNYFIGINSGGAGLGYGLGASIGAALHYKDSNKICIDLQSDGDFLFTPSALWTAAHYKIPLLIIIMNNRSYAITKKISKNLAKHRDRDFENAHIGTVINNPDINYSQMAQSYGVKTFDKADTLEKLSSILQEAIECIKNNQEPVLIDVVFQDME